MITDTAQLTDTAVKSNTAGYIKTDTVIIPDTVSPKILWKNGKLSHKLIYKSAFVPLYIWTPVPQCQTSRAFLSL